MRAPAGVRAGLVRAGLVGAASGARSQIGTAAVAVSGRAETAPEPLDLLAGRPAVIGTVTAAVGELIADKLPATPSRLTAAGLVPRVVLGGLAAAVLAADAVRVLAPPPGRRRAADDGKGSVRPAGSANSGSGSADSTAGSEPGSGSGAAGSTDSTDSTAGSTGSAGSAERPAPSSPGPVLLATAGAVGGAAAVAAAFAGARWRRRWSLRGHDDWPAAVLEDLAALALAGAACTRPTPPPRTGDAAW
ncbi:hypothetical protein AB0399_23835 [Streptomyces sp. NPDC088194]|uniref:hypothetical protein n=1 Tax=Streptomyces sp. NPDC088194 TaxID=3154931 RepID=UPI0034505210